VAGCSLRSGNFVPSLPAGLPPQQPRRDDVRDERRGEETRRDACTACQRTDGVASQPSVATRQRQRASRTKLGDERGSHLPGASRALAAPGHGLRTARVGAVSTAHAAVLPRGPTPVACHVTVATIHRASSVAGRSLLARRLERGEKARAPRPCACSLSPRALPSSNGGRRAASLPEPVAPRAPSTRTRSGGGFGLSSATRKSPVRTRPGGHPSGRGPPADTKHMPRSEPPGG
jgi:hypothetical protein